uniref:Uncharacterized protein n=1 Tax=Kalanchoe fedtschenkoi TaxID=63787 RepID=A0A7N0TC53_KALFE
MLTMRLGWFLIQIKINHFHSSLSIHSNKSTTEILAKQHAHLIRIIGKSDPRSF